MAESQKDTKFQLGNEYWKLRSKDGRDAIYTDPLLLSQKCNDYFQWVESNPLYESVVQKRKISRDEEKIEMVSVPKMRPFTITGLCNFLDIAVNTWKSYKEKPDFLTIITRAEQIIYNQKFEGAASGFLNPNIIARDLGLVDKREDEIKLEGVSKEELADIANKINS